MVLKLRFMQGLNCPAIGRTLGISHNAAAEKARAAVGLLAPLLVLGYRRYRVSRGSAGTG